MKKLLNKKGFTLAELLIFIGAVAGFIVIAIYVAMFEMYGAM